MIQSQSMRILTLEDYPAVCAIFKDIFPKKYNEEFQNAWLRRATPYSFVLMDEGKVKAFCITSFREDYDNTYHIEFLGVDPHVQKGGWGTTLLQHVLSSIPVTYDVTLIPVNDRRIIHWYIKHGFLEYGPSRFSKFTGETEQLMRLHRTLVC